MLTENALRFLSDLSLNNDRDWFHANKARYEKDVKKPFEAFVAALIERAQALDPAILITPRQAIFRIHRDTRFSANKEPYKTHVSAIISPFGTRHKEYPGFYVQVSADKLWLGGGAYFLEKESLLKIRETIAENGEELTDIVQHPDFVQHYGEVLGEKNKRLTPEFQTIAAKIPLIANKQFYFMAELEPETALGAQALDRAMDYYLAGKPLCDFLAQAMGD
ncbi:MAG TPA: DUF2461 domain-containing protein [Saprospiraceae bacterium]|nr:DUF2461 domain-containing protein [Saprospiraceae bacterium]HRJ15311.1 DUF2461 domain-containing protein [Saprospiraceae bacterium]